MVVGHTIDGRRMPAEHLSIPDRRPGKVTLHGLKDSYSSVMPVFTTEAAVWHIVERKPAIDFVGRRFLGVQ